MIQSVWGVHTEYRKGKEGLDGVFQAPNSESARYLRGTGSPVLGNTSQVPEG